MNMLQMVYKTRAESRLKATKDIEECRTVGFGLLQELGFSDFIFSPVSSRRRFEFTLSTTQQDLIRHYTDLGLDEYDVMMEYVVCNTKPIFQTEIYGYLSKIDFETDRKTKNFKLRDLFERYGIYDNLGIPIHHYEGGEKEIVMLAVYSTGKSANSFEEHACEKMYELNILANCLYKYGFKRYAEVFEYAKLSLCKTLTPQQMNVLKLLIAHGGSIEKVSLVLNRSKRTIEKHTESIRKTLGLDTTSEAIVYGIKCGLANP